MLSVCVILYVMVFIYNSLDCSGAVTGFYLLFKQESNMRITCRGKHCVNFGDCSICIGLRYKRCFLIISTSATILTGPIKMLNNSRYVWTAHPHHWWHFLNHNSQCLFHHECLTFILVIRVLQPKMIIINVLCDSISVSRNQFQQIVTSMSLVINWIGHFNNNDFDRFQLKFRFNQRLMKISLLFGFNLFECAPFKWNHIKNRWKMLIT